MNAFEDEMRRAMASHDDEAPRAGELLRFLERAAPPRRRLAGWYAPLAVAAAVVAVVAGSLWSVRLLGGQPGPGASPQPASRVAALACPARYAKQAPWVPAKPAGADGRARLVPQQTPGSAVICAYAGSDTAKQQAGWALSGRRSLTGNLAGLAGQLSWQAPRLPGQRVVCLTMGGPQTNYLIGLKYSGGAIVWVAATDGETYKCRTASNGEFVSFGAIGPEVTHAFRSGQWPTRAPVSCDSAFQGAGRLGEDKTLIPAGPTSLTVCLPKVRTFTSGFEALVRALDRLPTRPKIDGCIPTNLPPTRSVYELSFSYAQGPPVTVMIIVGCVPEVQTAGLQAHSASSVVPIIQQLLNAK